MLACDFQLHTDVSFSFGIRKAAIPLPANKSHFRFDAE
jgi:hypothetical protein